MIVSKKLLIAFAAVPIIFAILVAVPWISPGADQGPLAPPAPISSTADSSSLHIRIQFVREDMKRVSFGVTESLGAQKREVLALNNDGSAIYNIDVEGGKGAQTTFRVDSQDLKRIKALAAETGFMELPTEGFGVKEDAEEFTRYTLTVNIDGQTKRVQWADEPASEGFVPPLVIQIRDMLLAAMKVGSDKI